MAPGVEASGQPSIRVVRRLGGSEARTHIDAVTAAFVEPPPAGSAGQVAAWLCPRCQAPLDAEPACARCGAPTFSARVPGDEILWCARIGCGWTRWTSEDAEGRRPVVELVVEDDGRGIPAEDRARLFEPFFSTKGTRGTGLGLSVSWGLVEEHGGWIEVESDPGKGSRFRVRLPMPAAVPAPGARA